MRTKPIRTESMGADPPPRHRVRWLRLFDAEWTVGDRAVIQLVGTVLMITFSSAGTPGVTLAQSPGASERPDLVELVERSRSILRLEEGRLAGPGAKVLHDAVAGAHHVLIGEQHLTQEIPALAEALLPALVAAGVSGYVIETGPISAEILVSLVRGEGEESVEEALRARPRSFPFFDHAEEISLLRRALDAGLEVWGVDQEFFFSGRMFLERLAVLAPNDEARALVAAWQEQTRRDLGRALTGAEGAELLLSASAEQIGELRAAFSGAGGDAVPEATRILDAIADSAAVYRLYREGANYESNHHRISLMKRHLREHMTAAGSSAPKLLFKLGTMHMGRGYSPLNQLDLGNHAAELAAAAGGESLHLVAMALAFQPRGGEARPSGGLDGLEPLSGRVAEAGWTLFDLRALRPHFHSRRNAEAHPELSGLVWRYDIAAFAPLFRGATPALAK